MLPHSALAHLGENITTLSYWFMMAYKHRSIKLSKLSQILFIYLNVKRVQLTGISLVLSFNFFFFISIFF